MMYHFTGEVHGMHEINNIPLYKMSLHTINNKSIILSKVICNLKFFGQPLLNDKHTWRNRKKVYILSKKTSLNI